MLWLLLLLPLGVTATSEPEVVPCTWKGISHKVDYDAPPLDVEEPCPSVGLFEWPEVKAAAANMVRDWATKPVCGKYVIDARPLPEASADDPSAAPPFPAPEFAWRAPLTNEPIMTSSDIPNPCQRGWHDPDCIKNLDNFHIGRIDMQAYTEELARLFPAPPYGGMDESTEAYRRWRDAESRYDHMQNMLCDYARLHDRAELLADVGCARRRDYDTDVEAVMLLQLQRLRTECDEERAKFKMNQL
jgi:hypothetical protein